MVHPPYPGLDDLLDMMGDAGSRLSEIGACEGAAGNISVCLRWPIEARTRFPVREEIELPQAVPELAGAAVIVSGSGRRLREIRVEPTANLACIIVAEGGRSGEMFTSSNRRFERVTSEFNSHLAVHYDQMCATNTNFLALIHAQPLYLTYLSHIPRYREADYLSRRLLRWQPELIINLPEGIHPIAFQIPGSDELVTDNVRALRQHRVVVWCKHGAMARSDVSVKRAADLIEYAETAARYEYINLAADEPADGLAADEIKEICRAFGVAQNIF